MTSMSWLYILGSLTTLLGAVVAALFARGSAKTAQAGETDRLLLQLNHQSRRDGERFMLEHRMELYSQLLTMVDELGGNQSGVVRRQADLATLPLSQRQEGQVKLDDQEQHIERLSTELWALQQRVLILAGPMLTIELAKKDISGDVQIGDLVPLLAAIRHELGINQ